MFEFKTSDNVNLNVTALNWSEARVLLQSVDTQLVAIIDKISPSDNEGFMYKATYPFGNQIIKNGVLYLSTEDGASIAYNDPSVPLNLSSNIAYDSLSESPLAIVLDKNLEMFLTVDKKPFPLKVISPGGILGLSNIVDKKSNRVGSHFETLVAGARSAFMVAKVSDVNRHRDLKIAYNLKQNRPQSFFDHWLVFKDIAHMQKSAWRSTILFFSNDIFKKIKDPAWIELYNYFLQKYISKLHSRHLVEWNRILGYVEQKRNLRFILPVINMARHLFAIANGDELCFRPATNTSSVPLNLIQEAYIHGYGLKEYSPIIMEPAYIKPYQKDVGYYFCNYSTLPQLEFELSGTVKRSIMNFIKEVQYVIDIYQDSLQHDATATQCSLSALSRIVDFFYYHDEPKDDASIKNIDEFFSEDARFLHNQVGDFPRHSQMLRGCMKISYKNP
ncbi:MAG: hypothetical protein LW807_04235 [Proteobacteria bacterium]|nr:hypothetical protein [Pseudomonadota bacterium]